MPNRIEQYDKELQEDIESLTKWIHEDEEMAKAYGIASGSSEKEQEEYAKRRRKKGKHLYMNYPQCMASDWLLQSLNKLERLLGELGFRMYLNWPSPLVSKVLDPLSIEIITEDDSFYFNPTVLDDYEQSKLVEHIYVTIPFNRYMVDLNMRHCYPSIGLVRLILKLRMKYKDEQVLAKMPVIDKRAWDIVSRLGEEAKYGSIDSLGNALLGSND